MRDFNYNMNKKEWIKRRSKKKSSFKMQMELQRAGKTMQSAKHSVERKMRIFYMTNIPWKRSHKKRERNCNKEK